MYLIKWLVSVCHNMEAGYSLNAGSVKNGGSVYESCSLLQNVCLFVPQTSSQFQVKTYSSTVSIEHCGWVVLPYNHLDTLVYHALKATRRGVVVNKMLPFLMWPRTGPPVSLLFFIKYWKIHCKGRLSECWRHNSVWYAKYGSFRIHNCWGWSLLQSFMLFKSLDSVEGQKKMLK